MWKLSLNLDSDVEKTLNLDFDFSAFSISEPLKIEITTRFSHWNMLGIRVGLIFQYSEVSFWGPGGSFLKSWMTLWASSSPQGHLLRHFGGPNLDFIDFGCVLGPPSGVTFDIVWRQFCDSGCER